MRTLTCVTGLHNLNYGTFVSFERSTCIFDHFIVAESMILLYRFYYNNSISQHTLQGICTKNLNVHQSISIVQKT